MEFGPEIKVYGKRPEWLEDFELISLCNFSGSEINLERQVSRTYWANVKSIRLPANHPHYNLITHTYTVRPEDEAALLASDPLSRPTPDERAVAPELVERLVELARSVADSPECTIRQTVEAQGILAILDTVASDEIVAKQLCKDNGWGESSGAKDLAMKALARGRQLEKEGK